MTDVEADPNGGIWVGTDAGFARFDGTNWILYNQANTGMPGTVVSDVARRASDGLIAIASNQGGTFPYTGGVSTFNGTTWTHYTPENSPLTHWQVVAVEFDAQRQSLGQRHERRCCADHDWRAGGNTDANANRYSNCHTDSYSKRDTNCNTNGNSHCNANPHRHTDCYYYAYSKAYPITEGSFYTAASRNSAAKALIGVHGIAMKTLSSSKHRLTRLAGNNCRIRAQFGEFGK